MLPWRYY